MFKDILNIFSLFLLFKRFRIKEMLIQKALKKKIKDFHIDRAMLNDYALKKQIHSNAFEELISVQIPELFLNIIQTQRYT